MADGIAAVPLPATLAELSAGYFDLLRAVDNGTVRSRELNPPAALDEQAEDLTTRIERLFGAYGSLRSAAELRELDDADAAIADAQTELEALDDLSADLEVPECGASTFGPDHLANAATLVAAERQAQAPTGDFVTDANTICARFAGDIADAPLPTDPVNFQLYVSSLTQAYELLGRDLDALTPPAGSEAQVDEFVATIDEAVTALRRASTAAVNADEQDVARLQQELGDLGTDLSTQAVDLGLTC